MVKAAGVRRNELGSVVVFRIATNGPQVAEGG